VSVPLGSGRTRLAVLAVPPPPPDLDCSDVRERRFTVLPHDPHDFDGDHNGIGCETS